MKLVKDNSLSKKKDFNVCRAQNNQPCLLLQLKISVYLKPELWDFVSQEQKTKVLVIRAVFPAVRYRLKLCSCPLYSRNLIEDPLVKGLMWYPNGTQFLSHKSTIKGIEPSLYHFSGECCREVGNDGQMFGLGLSWSVAQGKCPFAVWSLQSWISVHLWWLWEGDKQPLEEWDGPGCCSGGFDTSYFPLPAAAEL